MHAFVDKLKCISGVVDFPSLISRTDLKHCKILYSIYDFCTFCCCGKTEEDLAVVAIISAISSNSRRSKWEEDGLCHSLDGFLEWHCNLQNFLSIEALIAHACVYVLFHSIAAIIEKKHLFVCLSLSFSIENEDTFSRPISPLLLLIVSIRDSINFFLSNRVPTDVVYTSV